MSIKYYIVDAINELWNPVMKVEYLATYESDTLRFDIKVNCYIKNNTLLYFVPQKIHKYELKYINKWNERVWDDYPVQWHDLTGIEQELVMDELGIQLFNNGVEHDRMECLDI